MRLVDYLAKRKRYKELRRQLRKVESDRKITTETYNLYKKLWDEKTKKAAIEKWQNTTKQINFLEQELRNIFKE
jgi:DNA-binding transcriptional regulator GbsR (MarR family)